MMPSPRWVWSRAGWATTRRPNAADIMASVHHDVVRLVAVLPGNRTEYWPGWYPEVGAYVERVGDDEWIIAFYDEDPVIAARMMAPAPTHSTGRGEIT